MVQIIQAPPDPGMQWLSDYTSRLQEERYRREQERAQEREAQQQRLIAGVGLGLGAVGGIAIAGAMAPAAVASASGMGALAAGTPITAAGTAAGLSTAGTISAGLTGAAVGGSIAQQFGAGDIAGGVSTAAGAARGLMQSMEDQRLYGYSPTKQERAQIATMALKAGMTMPQLKGMASQMGVTVPEALQIVQFERADAQQTQDILDSMNIPMSAVEFDQFAANYPTRRDAFFAAGGEVAAFEARTAAQKAFATDMAQANAGIAAAVQHENMEWHYAPQALANHALAQQDIAAAVDRGELTPEQGRQLLAGLEIPQPRPVPRQTPMTIEEDEEVSTKTGNQYVRDRDGRRRQVGNVRDARDKEMTDQQFAAVINKELDALWPQRQLMPPKTLDAETGKLRAMTEQEMEAAAYQSFLRKAAMRDQHYQAGQQQPVVSQPQPPAQPQPAAAQPSAPAPPQQPQSQLERDADLLTMMSMTSKIEEWTPTQRRNAAAVAARFQDSLVETYGDPKNVPPELLPALRFALRVLKGK